MNLRKYPLTAALVRQLTQGGVAVPSVTTVPLASVLLTRRWNIRLRRRHTAQVVDFVATSSTRAKALIDSYAELLELCRENPARYGRYAEWCLDHQVTRDPIAVAGLFDR